MTTNSQSHFPAAPTPHVWLLETHITGENNKRLGLTAHMPETRITPVPHRRIRDLAAQLPLSLRDMEKKDKATAGKIRRFADDLVAHFGQPDIVVSSAARPENTLTPLAMKLFYDVFWLHIGRPKYFDDLVDLALLQPWTRGVDRADPAKSYVASGIPHHVTPEALESERAHSAALFEPFAGKRKVLVLVGGETSLDAPTKCYTDALLDRLAATLKPLQTQKNALFISNSRRTPPEFWSRLKTTLSSDGTRFVEHDDPKGYSYIAMLAHADVCVVMADSISMQWEAAATNKPVFSFLPWEGTGYVPKTQARSTDILLNSGRVSHARVENIARCLDAPVMHDPVNVNCQFAAAAMEAVHKWLPTRNPTPFFRPRLDLIRKLAA